ncbi:deoxynucleoside triphosphate triphosphohydrolase SAMHD1-like isoform X2 [Mya arenaria]|nr:deoxynucleoside triphosphate triphosphohydrolase SAMHD1-like isoform X2 [Mya arenaria]
MDVQKSDGESSHKKARLNEDYSKWDAKTLYEELKEKGLGNVAEIFRVKKIAGDTLKQIEEFIEKVKTSRLPLKGQKEFNDPIHGLIELHPLCVKIIDTPEFQRLRFVKQLGTTYFVYPGAAHNRFEHSLGVCHLAGRLVRAIKSRQPDLGITDKDVLCVEIAGLCHDLGHGPFSHLFDREFIPKVRPGTTWEHEQASIELLDYMIDKRNLDPEFEKYDITKTDKTFIKEQIWPEMKGDGKFKGRPDKPFLYEIVANMRNGIDVDKWDYFARDCYMLGIQNNFDHNRCIHFARVLDAKGDSDEMEKQICTREKEAGHLYDMFYTRYMLYRRAYKHKTVSSIDFMVTEALIEANDCIMFTGKNGEEKKMSEAIHDMEAYSKMTDQVMFMILNMNDENLPKSINPDGTVDVADFREKKEKLAKSKEILNNVMSRNFTYIFTMHAVAEGDIKEKEKDIEKAVKEIIEKENPDQQNFDAAGIKVQIVKLDYGKKGKNPMDYLMFYSKTDLDKAVHIKKGQVSSFLPRVFQERHIRLYCKGDVSEDLKTAASDAFDQWCEKKGYIYVREQSSDE